MLSDDMIQFEHTHMHVYAWIPPIESKWLVQRHVMNRSRSVWGLYDFRRTRHSNVVKWYSNMHARITSIHMHVVVVLEWYTPSRGYRRQAYIFVGPHGHPWSPWPTTRLVTMAYSSFGSCSRSIGHGEIRTLSLSAYTMHACMHESPSLAWSVV